MHTLLKALRRALTFVGADLIRVGAAPQASGSVFVVDTSRFQVSPCCGCRSVTVEEVKRAMAEAAQKVSDFIALHTPKASV
jgi:hypothetical protein